MEISGIGRNYSANPTGKDAASTGTALTQDEDAKPAYEAYDRLVHGLTKLTEATAKVDEEAKARAKQKLKDAQEQLKFMQRWGMDPEVIARQAAQLGVVVAAAAREFAEALAGGGAAPGSASTLASTSASKPAEAQPLDASVETSEETSEEQNASQAEQAYRDVMDDRAEREKPRLSPDDIRTAAEFSAIAQQIKALLEKAARELRAQNNAAAVQGTQNLDAAVASVTNIAVAASPIAITI